MGDRKAAEYPQEDCRLGATVVVSADAKALLDQIEGQCPCVVANGQGECWKEHQPGSCAWPGHRLIAELRGKLAADSAVADFEIGQRVTVRPGMGTKSWLRSVPDGEPTIVLGRTKGGEYLVGWNGCKPHERLKCSLSELRRWAYQEGAVEER